MRVAEPERMPTVESSAPILDHALVAELRTLGADVVAEIFELFIADVPARLAKLTHAINERSPDAILREAHGLKGSALGIGATRFAMLCAAIEHDARENQLDSATARLSALEPEFAEVRRAITDAGDRDSHA
jgi:HPt (histidine-containing phosphotransfer) domain-containing protein